MNFNRKMFFGALLCALMAGQCRTANADPWDTLEGYLFPQYDQQYVEDIPKGHLHKNKPRYGNYVNWHVVETQHFQLYVYNIDPRLENFFKHECESAYADYTAETGVKNFTEKIRTIIYDSSRDFEEANTIPGIVPKGLGGVTDTIKWKRMTIAYRDSPKGFRLLLRHELFHRFQGEILQLTLMNAMYRDAPLWFMEGSAEHMAHTWDSWGETIMRYLYLENYLASVSKFSVWYNGNLYQEGEFICDLIAKTYKQKGEVITKILQDIPNMKFPEAFKKETGDSLEEFDKKLEREIQQRYSPLRAKVDIADEAKSLGRGILLSARDQFFLTRENIYGRETLILNWTNGIEVKSENLVSDGHLKSVNLRGFPIEVLPPFGFQEHGASFASSATVVYAMDAGASDTLVVQNFSFDQKKKKFHLGEQTRYQFPDMHELQHPVMISDHEVAFVGRKTGGIFSELFVANLDSHTVRQLTDDQRTYQSLTYSSATNSLFTSIENEATDSYDLAKYDLAKNTFTYLTQTPENEFWPVASPDGASVLYVSDKGLVHNINRLDLLTHRVEVLTDAKVGVFRPQWFGDNGLAFNSFSTENIGKMEIKVAPLAQTISTSTAIAISTESPVSIWNMPEVQKLKAKIPNADAMTLFDVALSSDKTRAVFAENRKLSLDVLKKHESEIRFHVVDLSTKAIVTFTVKKFSDMKHYGAMDLLQGTNLLLQRHSTLTEEREIITENGSRYTQEEVTYKDWYVYDWEAKKIYNIDTEASTMFTGSDRPFSMLSPDKRYMLWSDNNKNRLVRYDIIAKTKKTLSHEFYEIQDIKFVSTGTIMVLDKEWDYDLVCVDVSFSTSTRWTALMMNTIKAQKGVVWYPTCNGNKSFFIIPHNETGLDIFLFDSEKSTATQVASEVPLVKNSEIKDNALELTVANPYGLDRVMKITSTGTVTFTDQPFAYTSPRTTETALAKETPVVPRFWDLQNIVPSRTRTMDRVPKVMHAYGAGGVSFGSQSGFQSYLVLGMLAFDEIDNRALETNIYLQNSDQGLADIEYENFENGRDYFLNYWNFDGDRHKTDIGVTKNIFLHPLLNWDATFKQQQVTNHRDNMTVDWWRSTLGTTLSLDTTIWDCEATQWTCHGPHSGASVFTGSEMGIDNRKGFQTINANIDARYHIPLSDRIGIALRAIGGHSFGPNPTVFVWGGNGTLRGIPLFSQAGNAYAMQSTEFRIPILDAGGAILSGPVGHAFAPLTLYFDIRGGIYNDIGDIWYTGDPLFDGHRGFHAQESAGYFINIPTMLGINFRMNKGFYGKQGWNIWLGYNW